MKNRSPNLSKLALMFVLICVSVSARKPDIDLADIEIPSGYESYREANFYVRFGDGSAELRLLAPKHEFDSAFLDDWFYDDVIAYMEVSLVALPGGISTSEEAHQSLVSDLKARWGDYSFSIYDPESGIGRFVNYAGAFVAVSWRRVGATLVIVESQDLVEVLVAKSSTVPETSAAEDLWQHFHKAANAEHVDSLLIGLRSE